MAAITDKINEGNYLLRDVSASEAHESPEKKLENEQKLESKSAHARSETVPSAVGDRTPNVAHAEMTKPAISEAAKPMIQGVEVDKKLDGVLIAKADTPELIDGPRKDLTESINKLGEKDVAKQMQDNMTSLEDRLAKGDIASSDVAQVYKSVDSLLRNPGKTNDDSLNREYLAQSILEDVAHPRDTNQGGRDTCGVSAIRERMLVHIPGEAAKLAVDTLLSDDGKVKLGDSKTVNVDKNSLGPDEDAIDCIADPEMRGRVQGKRSYFGQVIDNALMNGIVQTRDSELTYKELQSTKLGDKGTEITRDGKAVDFDWRPTPEEVGSIGRMMLGEKGLVLTADSASDSTRQTKSPDELWKTLQELSNPIAFVHTNNDVFNRPLDPNGHGDGHYLSIANTKVSENGDRMVQISDQLGKPSDRWISVEQLHRTMQTADKN